MEGLVISGGRALHGQIAINGAKNAVLPIMAATVVHGGTYVLEHCPDITDVRLASDILTYLGGSVLRIGKTLIISTEHLSFWQIPSTLMSQMRASVLFLGALLARFGKAVLTMPGGCPLGQRPIDLHLRAMAQLGASVTMEGDQILCEGKNLRGCVIELPIPSVGATENSLLAAMGAEGTTILRGAAREPEIGDLIGFLQTMGGKIGGAGTDCLEIAGRGDLHDARYAILPDRIETATYLCAAAACGGDVLLSHTDLRLLLPVAEALTKAGCRIFGEGSGVRIRSEGCLRSPGALETGPYPGFPTDAQAIMMAALIRARGVSQLTEHIFSDRLSHAVQLQKFGAQIETTGNTARIRGTQVLHPACVEAGDLRAAAALILAALQIPGESCILGLNHLHRGYDSLEENLSGLGACLRKAQ